MIVGMGLSKVFLALVVLAAGVTEIKSSRDAMKYITSGFVKVLEECKREVSKTFYLDFVQLCIL